MWNSHWIGNKPSPNHPTHSPTPYLQHPITPQNHRPLEAIHHCLNQAGNSPQRSQEISEDKGNIYSGFTTLSSSHLECSVVHKASEVFCLGGANSSQNTDLWKWVCCGRRRSTLLRVCRWQVLVGVGRLIVKSSVWLEFSPCLCIQPGDRRTGNEFSYETPFYDKMRSSLHLRMEEVHL